MVGLIKRVDGEVYGKGESKRQAFVVFLTDATPELQLKLAALAEKEKLRVPLTIHVDGARNPKGYPVAPDAHATVIAYEGREVKWNRAFRKGELDAAAIEAVGAALAGPGGAGGGGAEVR